MSGSARVRAVLDANVLVSYLLTHGSVAWRAVDHVLERGEPLVSEPTFDELWEVLHRPKFDRYVDPQVRYEFLTRVLRYATVVEPRERIRACADPDDDRFLEAAVAGNADVIVTGDRQLLALNPFRSIEIITPADYLRRFGTGG